MSAFFHPQADEWRDEAWDAIKSCQSLDWLILTKRSERIIQCLPVDRDDGYANVWLAVAAGCESSLHRVDTLLSIPAAIRFISAEPLLERLDLAPYHWGIDWVITGCERTKKGVRRLMDIDWVRAIDQQCRNAGVAHFFKQYYDNDRGVPREDGMLDGDFCQSFPPVPHGVLMG